MSFISSLGGSSGLTGFLQKLTGKKQSVATAANSPSNLLQNILSPGSSGASPLGGHAHGNHALMQKIQSAVSSALQTLSQSGASSATGATDPNTAIQNAIVGVLNNAADGSVIPDQDNAQNPAPPQTPASQFASTHAFQQLLQANGISPQQFQSDFQSALDQVKQGGVNLATIFKNFAPGSLVDVTA